MEYELYHHGILGMKWGIRRYQNPDGSLTPAGRKRLQQNARRIEKAQREYERAGFFERGKAKAKYDKARDRYDDFAKKLEYAKMSDSELLDASKNFVRNNFNSALTSQNVKAGEMSLAEKVKIFSSMVSAATDTVALVGKAKDVFGKADRVKRDLDLRKMKLDERRQELEEKKQKLDERQKKIDERKVAVDESRDKRYWESYRESAKRSKDSSDESGSYKRLLGDEEKDEIKKKTK